MHPVTCTIVRKPEVRRTGSAGTGPDHDHSVRADKCSRRVEWHRRAAAYHGDDLVGTSRRRPSHLVGADAAPNHLEPGAVHQQVGEDVTEVGGEGGVAEQPAGRLGRRDHRVGAALQHQRLVLGLADGDRDDRGLVDLPGVEGDEHRGVIAVRSDRDVGRLGDLRVL